MEMDEKRSLAVVLVEVLEGAEGGALVDGLAAHRRAVVVHQVGVLLAVEVEPQLGS